MSAPRLVGQHSYTDIDYADDVTLFVDQQDKYLTDVVEQEVGELEFSVLR